MKESGNIHRNENVHKPESFSKEIVSLKSGKPITRFSKVPRLDPFLIHSEFYVLVED